MAIMTDTPCERCSILPEPGHAPEGFDVATALRSQQALDQNRALRLVLATLKADIDDGDARWNLLENELGTCRGCWRGTLVSTAGLYAATLESDAADDNPDDDAKAKDTAISHIESMIVSGIDERLSGE